METPKSTYDRLSRWYDLLASSEQRLVRLGVETLGAQAGERVLEIGPGTGHAVVALARAVGRAGKVVGVDLAPGMLDQTRRRIARAGEPLPVHLACADGARLPVPAACFDAVFMSFTLELFDGAGADRVLGECRRALRPGGRIGVVSLSQRGGRRAMLRAYGWAHARFPAWIDCRPIDPAAVLRASGFAVHRTAEGAVWGLPVEVVVGRV